jgi:hypothetical protein
VIALEAKLGHERGEDASRTALHWYDFLCSVLAHPGYAIVWDGSTGRSDSLGSEEQTTVNVVN